MGKELEDYDYYADEYGSGIEKVRSKKRNPFKGKGHQSKHSRPDWDTDSGMDEEDASAQDRHDPEERPAQDYRPRDPIAPSAPLPSSTAAVQERVHREFIFGPHTREVRPGIKIDYDGVADIKKVDNVYSGRQTYGVTFFFKGAKKLYRTVWFNCDKMGRDSFYETEYAYWRSVSSAAAK